MAFPHTSGPLDPSKWNTRLDIQKCVFARRRRSLQIQSPKVALALLHSVIHEAPADGRIRWQAVMIGVIVVASMSLALVFLLIDFAR